MKKTLKHVLAMAVSLVMLLALCVPAFAQGSTPPAGAGSYTITIENAEAGHVYKAYQIFAGSISDDGNNLGVNAWGTGINSAELLAKLKTEFSEAGFETNMTAAAAATAMSKLTGTDDAMKLATVINKHLPTTVTGTSGAFIEAGKKYEITGVPAGYYFVQDVTQEATVPPTVLAYSGFILKVAGNATVQPKTEVPKLEKKVYENGYEKAEDTTKYGKGFNDVADYNVGDDVSFKLIGTMPTNIVEYTSYKYQFNDLFGVDNDSNSVFTLNADSIKVSFINGEQVTAYDMTNNPDKFSKTADNAEESALAATATDKIGVLNAPATPGFSVMFTDIKTFAAGNSITLDKDTKVVVEYTAKINKYAEIGLPGNENSAFLNFSNNPSMGADGTVDHTPLDKVVVFTYELDGNKVDGANKDTKLSGATFKLYKATEDPQKNAYAVQNAETGVWTWVEAAVNSKDTGTTLTSTGEGKFVIKGIDDGTYYLREIDPPAGYNLPDHDFEIVLTATIVPTQAWNAKPSTALTDLTVKIDNEHGVGDPETGIGSVTIANNKGSTLPETGGMGTTLFTVIGIALMAGAGVLLVTKKRMDKNN